jgi:HNH endonuclease
MKRDINMGKRLPVDQFVWDIFVEACGSRCACCGEENAKLERGHRIPHASEGPASYDNLIPVCRPCNKRHLKTETPDHYRPADYLERFYLLLGERLRPQISGSTVNGVCYLIPSSYHVDKKHVIGWKNAENGPSKEVFTQSCNVMTRAEAERAVEQLITAARRKTPPPNYPFPAAKTELLRIAIKYGQQFNVAADGFLADEPWQISGSEDQVHHDSWTPLTANFEQFLRLGEQRLAAVQKRKQREDEEQQRNRVQNRQQRWDTFRLAAKCTDWPGITDEDRAFITAVGSETELRDLTENEVLRAQQIRSTEFVAKRKAVVEFLNLCDMLIVTGELSGYSTAIHRDTFGAARTVDQLRSLHKHVQQLYDTIKSELGPNDGTADQLFQLG